jgi:cell surface protein SprA
MRSLNSTNFEQGNVDYIQFWVMDPYIGKGNYSKQFRKLLGEISEDVLKDGRKQYENGLGPDQILVNPDRFGEMFQLQSLIYAFDTNANNRSNQKLDGLSDANEGQCTLISRLKLIQLLMITFTEYSWDYIGAV